MELLILLLAIAVIGAVIWRLRSRTSRSGTDSVAADIDSPPAPLASTGGPGAPAATSAGTPPVAAAPAAAPPASVAPVAVPPAAGPPAAPAAEPRPETAEAEGEGTEWETQWSETLPQDPHAPGAAGRSDHAARGVHAAEEIPAHTAAAAATGAPVHHPEYTGAHAPTLPGAESAAAESTDAGEVEGATAAGAVRTPDTTGSTDAMGAPEATEAPDGAAPAATSLASGAAVPPAVAAEVPGLPPAEAGRPEAATPAPVSGISAGPGPELSGHLALEQPYGEGSAAPAADGSGPEDFTVKAEASSMTYYEETSPGFEETRAEVWFLSPAHAEAAGFRPPRRTRR